MVRFGIDGNSYEIEEFSKLDNFNICSKIFINTKGLKFRSNCLQDVYVDFELVDNFILSGIINTITNIYKKEKLFFDVNN
jgi:hypothetical protein